MKKDFDERYRLTPKFQKAEKIAEEIQTAERQQLSILRKRSFRSSQMEYFEQIVTSPRRVEEIKRLKGPKVGFFCNLVPEELIFAAGALPIRLCAGVFPTVKIAEEVLPRDICAVVKSSFGLAMCRLPYIGLCDIVIVPTGCDAKKKLAKILNEYLPTWTFNLSQGKDYTRYLKQWLVEIENLREKLEFLTGRKITRKRLRETIHIFRSRQEVFRNLYQFRKEYPQLLNEKDILLITQASFYDDLSRWIERSQRLLKELENLSRGKEASFQNNRIRLLLTGAPIFWPNWKLLNIVEEAGADIVADTLCSGTQRLYDPVEVDEWTDKGMLRALSLRYLSASLCPCFIENTERIDRILELAQDFQVKGVIHHNLRLCQLFDMESVLIKEVLKDKNIPLLNISTDYSQEDTEQIKVRVEAFLEMIAGRKR